MLVLLLFVPSNMLVLLFVGCLTSQEHARVVIVCWLLNVQEHVIVAIVGWLLNVPATC